MICFVEHKYPDIFSPFATQDGGDFALMCDREAWWTTDHFTHFKDKDFINYI